LNFIDFELANNRAKTNFMIKKGKKFFNLYAAGARLLTFLYYNVQKT